MIIPGIVAEQSLWLGRVASVSRGFSVPIANVTYSKSTVTAIAPPYENKFVMTQNYAEAIIATSAQARITQQYIEVIVGT